MDETTGPRTRKRRTQKAPPVGEMNLVKLVEQFGSEDSCRAFLEKLRWPGGVACTRCGNLGVSRLRSRWQFDCNACRYQFSATSGTIFHDTHLPLWKWFLAAYLMCESKKGMSANQIKRSIAVSYKTAWYLCHRIRAAMSEASPAMLAGTVEADETYVGGVHRGEGRGFTKNKAVVMGVLERGGSVRMGVVPNRSRKELHAYIRNHVSPDAAAIYTDEWDPYKGIGDANTRHERVQHNIKEWVRGDVHTNGAESVWSLLKRSIIGSYHKVSTKHLDAYLDELEWRFNNRENAFLFRDTMRRLLIAENLPYRALVESRQSDTP